MESSVGTVVNRLLSDLEASATRHEFILPDHLFVALCKLEDVPGIARALGLPTSLISHLNVEVTQLTDLFKHFKLDPKAARRALRGLIGYGTFEANAQDTVIHRSSESRAA